MEETENKDTSDQLKPVKEHHSTVILEKNWKEYLVESALIVFSVLLALILTEVLTTLMKKRKRMKY